MKIFIDPGHGGKDPGAIGGMGTRECDVVLDIAVKLKDILTAAGVEAELSRSDDKTVSLAERAMAANSKKADLFISIHCNGFTNSGAKGTEVFAYNGDEKGLSLANSLLLEICNALGTVNRGAKTENFAVLRLTEMTAVLIETAFITNRSEEQMMLEKDFSEKTARAIAEGVFKFYGIFGKEVEHWGKKHLENLMSKGYIENPEMWEEFDGVPTKAMILALTDKITEVMKNENSK